MHIDGDLKASLLEVLSTKACCGYLSDLRRLRGEKRAKLASEIEKMSAEAASLKEWNEALLYLTGASGEKTPEEARRRLVNLLREPETEI